MDGRERGDDPHESVREAVAEPEGALELPEEVVEVRGTAGLEDFEEALGWLFSHRGIVRFYEDGDSARRFPCVRVAVPTPDDADRYVSVVGVADLVDPLSIQAALLRGAREVRTQYDEDVAADEVAQRRAQMRVV